MHFYSSLKMEEKNSISSLTIRSINVNSIGKNPKRAQILEFLRKIKGDIFILCDTRIEKNIENEI